MTAPHVPNCATAVAVSAPPSLAGADWLVSSATRDVFTALAAGGVEARAVGGVVRNALLGEAVTDIDLATPAPPDHVMALAARAGLQAVPTGIAHGTVTIISGHQPYEVTTLREDVSTDGRRATVAFTEDWAADARRRDFTMNALYCDAGGQVHDPLGGYPDLLAGHVRFIGDPRQRIREDYLRILRYFRFLARYGRQSPAASDLAACVDERTGLARLSGERVAKEMLGLLIAPNMARSLTLMQSYGLLTLVLPTAPRISLVRRLAAIESAYQRVPDAALRLALLAINASGDAERLRARLKLSNDAAETLGTAAAAIATTISSGVHLSGAPPDEGSAKVLLFRLGPRRFGQTLLTAWSLTRAQPSDPHWTAALSLPDCWQPPTFPLSGRDALALGIAPGPSVGIALRAVEAEWLKAGFSVPREHLIKRLRETLETVGASD